MCGICNVWACGCVGFVMSGCFVICVLVFNVFLCCFVYVNLFLFVLSVLL
jgi:hypothetical protein